MDARETDAIKLLEYTMDRYKNNAFDQEILHRSADEIILELLTDLGFCEVVKVYRLAQVCFWYS